MPTNVSYEYTNAEKEYIEATTPEEKLKALKKMISTVPRHKGTGNLRNQLKKKLSILLKDQDAGKKTGKRAEVISREGAGQVAIIGLPNSGKSTVLQELSGDHVKIASYAFTTKKPQVKMMKFENIWLQGIEIPAIYKGFSDAHRQYAALIRDAEFKLIILDGSKNPQKDLELIEKEMKNSDVELDTKKTAIVYTRQLAKIKTKYTQLFYLDTDKIVATIWSRLDKIRVQTRTRGKVAPKPIIMKKDATVKTLTQKVHRDFLTNFKTAKIWGRSAKFPGMITGLKHKLKDGDIVEIFTK